MVTAVTTDEEIGFPLGNPDERELLLSWLRYLRRAVLRKVVGLTDDEARWRPGDRLMPLLGIVHHLTMWNRAGSMVASSAASWLALRTSR